MSAPEVIINLWYFVDEEQQFIISLAGRAYIAKGTDEEKTALLQKLAITDYPLAIRRLVPDRYVSDYAGKMRPGIAHISELDNPATPLFEQVYQAIEEDISKMADEHGLPIDDYKIPANPLFVMTALYQDDYGEIHVLGA